MGELCVSARRSPMIINQSNDLECIKLRFLTKSKQAETTLESYIERRVYIVVTLSSEDHQNFESNVD